MSTTWSRTSLSTSPALREVADTDRTALAFAAGEPITTATADLVLLPDDTVVVGAIEDPIMIDLGTNVVTVIVSGLERGRIYELAVVFTRPDGTRWTKTLALRCVA